MNVRSLLLTVSLLPTALLVSGCPNCDYESRCDGDVVKICSMGVDQIAGDASHDRIPCPAESPTCVKLDKSTAECVRPGKPKCGDDFKPRCDGDLVVVCVSDYEVADDCTRAGNACTMVGEVPVCAMAPVTGCDPTTYVETCEGTTELVCTFEGVVARLDCAAGDPLATCVVHRSEYGRSVYCGVP